VWKICTIMDVRDALVLILSQKDELMITLNTLCTLVRLITKMSK